MLKNQKFINFNYVFAQVYELYQIVLNVIQSCYTYAFLLINGHAQ